jgi:hypothetical protein
VLGAVEHHVLVDLVADQQHVGGRQQVFSGACPRRPDGGAGVVRAVDDHGAVRGVMAAAILAKSGRKLPGVSGTRTHAAGQLDVGHVAVVAGLEHDHLVARLHAGQDGGEDGLRGAGGDGDLAPAS